MLDIPYPLLDECSTLMCYTDMKMSFRVELEVDSQNKTGEEAGSGSLRGMTGASGESGEAAEVKLSEGCHKAD